MPDNRLILGIDTSNYTTSIALCTLEGEVVLNLKKLLPVKEGERGLRQSDALFAHTKNLPLLCDELRSFLDEHYAERQIVAIGYSGTPRDVEGSYMPCFLSGVATASALSATLGCPSYAFSHQNGHIMAALYSAGRLDLVDGETPFAAFHVSGGTTEVLLESAKFLSWYSVPDSLILSIQKLPTLFYTNHGHSYTPRIVSTDAFSLHNFHRLILDAT